MPKPLYLRASQTGKTVLAECSACRHLAFGSYRASSKAEAVAWWTSHSESERHRQNEENRLLAERVGELVGRSIGGGQ